MKAELALLRGVSLFQDLDDDELLQIRTIADAQAFQQYEPIIKEGEYGDQCYIVLSGQVSVSIGGAFLGQLGVGSHFGEMALFDGAPRSATVIATEPTTVLVIRREPLLKMLSAPSPIAHKILWAIVQQLIHRLRRTNDELSVMMQESLMDEAALTRFLTGDEDLGGNGHNGQKRTKDNGNGR